MKGKQINSVQFTDDGVVIEYLDPELVRGNGLGIITALAIPGDPVFKQEIRDLAEAAMDLLELGLEELQRTRRASDDLGDGE